MHLLIWSAHEGRIGENHKMRILYGVEGPRFWNTTCNIPAWSGPSLKWNYIIATLRNHHGIWLDVDFDSYSAIQPSQIFASEHDGWAKALGWTATGSAPCRTRPMGAPLEGGMESPMEALRIYDDLFILCVIIEHILWFKILQLTVWPKRLEEGKGSISRKNHGQMRSTQKESKEVNRIWCHEGRRWAKWDLELAPTTTQSLTRYLGTWALSVSHVVTNPIGPIGNKMMDANERNIDKYSLSYECTRHPLMHWISQLASIMRASMLHNNLFRICRHVCQQHPRAPTSLLSSKLKCSCLCCAPNLAVSNVAPIFHMEVTCEI